MLHWTWLWLTIALCASAGASEPLPSFPLSFRWCVATAAHQIEGQNFDSDWWAWEQRPGNIKNGDSSKVADDSWRLWREDISMLHELGATQYRFSIEWSRIEPRQGEFNPEALKHYVDMVKALREAGIEPLVTLHHFTSPQWFADLGGWEWEGAPEAFARYTLYVASAMGDNVSTWVTFNEPTVFILGGYVDGIFPPGRRGPISDLAVPARQVLRAHALAYRILHAANPAAQVGMAHHLRVFDPFNSWNPLDRWAANILDQAFNWTFVDALENGRFHIRIPLTISVDETIPGLAGTQDFTGVNYYTRDLVSVDPSSPTWIARLTRPGAPVSDLGWEIYPEGFYRILKAASQHSKNRKILVTENGIADASDRQRPDFLLQHLTALQHARADGVNVQGYCHWSLLDNFEWAEGYTPRFGLFETDYTTLARHMRPSGKLFSQIAPAHNTTMAEK